jgi:glycosyltransferase involved in cell wall biosynthesis
MEASACGLPIISTFHGGIQDAVIHEKTGFLVDEMDVEKMANYMIYFCKNHKQANNLGLKGREHIKENYNQITQLQKIYKLAKESF